MISEKSGATKRAEFFKMVKSGNMRKKTCYLNPQKMEEHSSYFLQTFGKNPQGNIYDCAI